MKNSNIIAIMGPSGSGKTTLADNLAIRNNLAIPRHCTTRLPRNDDKEKFYRYFTHEKYKKEFDLGHFLISSGDGPDIKKEYGNFYGVLKSDCIDAFERSNTIILFVSYKDIDKLINLKKAGFNINIIDLTFTNIAQGIKNRLIGNIERNHTLEDIDSRIRNAVIDNEKYRQKINKYADIIVFTDIFDIENTYNEVYKKLKLK